MNQQEKIEELELAIEQVEAQIFECNEKIENIESEIDNFELDESDYGQSYDDMLDECYPDIPFGLCASRILEECDPIQYNCGLSEYVDSLDKTEDDSYQELTDNLDVEKGNLEDLNDDLENYKADLKELE